MPESGAWKFPFEYNVDTRSLKRARTVQDTIASAIKAFILTDPGSRRGNLVGSIVPSLLHNVFKTNQLESIEDEIQNELVNQFPGVTFHQVKIKRDLQSEISQFRLGITFSTPATELQELAIDITEQ